MTLPPGLQETLDALAQFPDRADRIQALISLAERYQPPARPRPFAEEHRVPGCESEVFLWSRRVGDGWGFDFAVENPQGVSAMALAVILQEGLEGESAEAIRSVSEDLIYAIFGRELSMGKSMGLMGMIQKCKSLVS